METDSSRFAWVWSSSGRGRRVPRSRFAFQPGGLGLVVMSTGVITTVLRISARFQTSNTRGFELLNRLWIVVLAVSVLMLLIFIQAWISPALRAVKIASLEGTRAQFVARLTPGLWEALRKVDPAIPSDARGTNINVAIEEEALSFWLGRVKPAIVAKITLRDVSGVALEYGQYKGITYRLMVVAVRSGRDVVEVPIFVAPLWSIGILPPSEKTRRRIAASIAKPQLNHIR
jgi:hypothetical protein